MTWRSTPPGDDAPKWYRGEVLGEMESIVIPGLREVLACRCGEPGEPEHTCPYAEDIHGDHATLCRCCGHCEHECAMDI